VSDFVFVYGSLKRGRLHHDELLGALRVGDAVLANSYLVLYEESYPALVLSGAESGGVSGELYEVDAPLLARLDEFEEVPLLYQRVRVALGSVSAWAYVIDESCASGYERLRGPW